MARPESEPKTALGARLRELRKNLGDLERDVVAQRIGVSKNSLASYERGETEPAASAIAAYRDAYGASPVWIVSGEGEMFEDASKVPKTPVEIDVKTLQRLVDTIEEVKEATVRPRHTPPRSEPRPPKKALYFPDHQVSAGFGRTSPYETEGEPIDMEELASRVLGLRIDDMLLFPIIGDSMFPTMASGDVAVADKSDRSIRDDTLYVVSRDGELLIKRASTEEEEMMIWNSDNNGPRYQPIRLYREDMDRVTVIGRVKWIFNAVPKRV